MAQAIFIEKMAPSGLPKMAWWSEEMAWMARMERMEREWRLQRSTLISATTTTQKKNGTHPHPRDTPKNDLIVHNLK